MPKKQKPKALIYAFMKNAHTVTAISVSGEILVEQDGIKTLDQAKEAVGFASDEYPQIYDEKFPNGWNVEWSDDPASNESIVAACDKIDESAWKKHAQSCSGNPNRPSEVTLELPRPLTSEEKIEILNRMVELNQQKAELEIGKKAQADYYKGEISIRDDETSELSSKARRGTVITSVSCKIKYKWDEKQKYIVRTDTGEVHDIQPISEKELQEYLEFEQPKEKKSSSESA